MDRFEKGLIALIVVLFALAGFWFNLLVKMEVSAIPVEVMMDVNTPTFMGTYQSVVAGNLIATDIAANTAATVASVNVNTAERAVENKFWAALRTGFAGAFRTATQMFARTVARDTATWIASGGKGQKPLFITEGWGEYIKNVGDSALGIFIEDFIKREKLPINFMSDICKPNFNVRLAIILGIKYDAIPKAKCKFSEMVNNWSKAINDASFGFEYKVYLQKENDIALYLETQNALFNYVDKQIEDAEKEVDLGEGFLAVKNFAQKWLTPGTVVKDEFKEATKIETLGKAGEQFTDTVWDFVETFLNTLVSAFLQRMQTGFFSDSSGGYDSINYDYLYDYKSAVTTGGRESAKEVFSRVAEAPIKVGSVYDILGKLMICTDDKKVKPGPTDCVIDSVLADAVSRRALVNDLSDSIKKRPFAPHVDQVTSPQTAFTLRNIVILRKYRIVPVGWEIAARYISGLKDSRGYTLGDLISLFEADKDKVGEQEKFLVGLVDPFWVLKAPELFCRREGYGPDLTNDQGGEVSRETYCADEQQCIKEDAGGNCLAFGYCTEEKRVWDISAQKCEPRFNTCQTFKTVSGAAASYLTNTLDFKDCNINNAGCRWYSALFNAVSNTWRHLTPTSAFNVCRMAGGCLVSAEAAVPQWAQMAGNVMMTESCAKEGGCAFDASCVIPAGGVRCQADLCVDDDVLATVNGNFDRRGSCQAPRAYDALDWTEGWVDASNGHSCAPGEGRSANALKTYSLNNVNEIVSSLAVDGLTTNKDYILNFYAKGRINTGGIKIQARSGGLTGTVLAEKEINAGEALDAWTNFNFTFNVQTENRLTLVILTAPGTAGTVLFDDFELKPKKENCAESPIWLYAGLTAVTETDEADGEIYFDRGAEKCDSASAGCNQFIRVKAGLGSNLVINGSFENDGDHDKIRDEKAYDGLYAIKLFDVNSSAELAVAGELLANHRYILSGYASSTAKTVDAFLGIKNNPARRVNITDFNAGGNWNRFTVTFTPTVNESNVRIEIKNDNIKIPVWFDAVKLEEVAYNDAVGTIYTPYEPSKRPSGQLAYWKKAPDYFRCYRRADGQWPKTAAELSTILTGRDSLCANYAPVCAQSEVGCEAFKPLNGDPIVSGTIAAGDLCPGECVGYQPYRQSQTRFVSAKNTAFIADAKPKYCSAAYAGCDEFTNLDAVAKGGEGLEYYVNIRACQKPDGTDNGSFVAWQGSGITGYALRDYRLKKSNSWKDAAHAARVDAPCVNLRYDDSGLNYCGDETIVNPAVDSAVGLAMTATGALTLNDYLDFLNASSTIGDPARLNHNVVEELHAFGFCAKQEIRGYYYFNDYGTQDLADDDLIYIRANPDCVEFYGVSGEVNYRLMSRVVHAADDCHPYRRTQTQLTALEAETDCDQSGGFWNTTGECVYMAIPNQGAVCSAEFKGCREYVGNRGDNLRHVFYSEFESGNLHNWRGGTLSAESLFVGGSSLAGSDILRRPVLAGKNKTYLLSFWAKGDDDFAVSDIAFENTPDGFDVFASSPVSIGRDWMKYDLGPVFVNWLSADQVLDLVINTGGRTIYLDNILLKEVKDNVYLVENTWFTPFSCDNKLDNPTGASCADKRCAKGEMLGCSAYDDRAGERFNLKSFSSLCRFEAIGCEAVIDTYNSESDETQRFNEGGENINDEVTVPADEMIYLVNDKKYACPAADKGCTAYGLPSVNRQDIAVGYDVVYLKNQPDNYGVSLCSGEAVWCDEYAGGRSTVWFKNPGEKICEYRSGSESGGAGWFKKGTDDACVVSDLQTIGYGALAEKIQPIGYFQAMSGTVNDAYAGWAGSCAVAQNGCSEFVDPSSDIYTDRLKNGGFENDFDSDGAPDGWTAVRDYLPAGEATVQEAVQTVRIEADTLYTLSAKVNGGRIGISVSCAGAEAIFYLPDATASLSADKKTATVSGHLGALDVSGRFYVKNPASCAVTVDSIDGGYADQVKLVKSGIYYVAGEVDRTSCVGQVDAKNGCVLFNDRGSINYNMDYGLSGLLASANGYLTFDADATAAKKQPASPVVGVGQQKNANVILKVKPNRQCDQWLYCTTFEEGDVSSSPVLGNNDRCLDLGLCSALGDNGECLNIVTASGAKNDETYGAASANKTGYATVGKLETAGDKVLGDVAGYYPYEQMAQVGESAVVPNGDFELVDFSAATSTSRNLQAEKGYKPLGWLTLNKKTISGVAKLVTEPWAEHKVSIRTDKQFDDNGTNYLRINAAYVAESEFIDVFSGEFYDLTGRIDTLNLYPIGRDVYAQIAIREYRSDGSNITGASCAAPDCRIITDANGDSWQYWRALSLNPGLPWTGVSQLIKTSSSTGMIKIRLFNWTTVAAVGSNCDNQDGDTYCDIAGRSLFDRVELKPVLKISANEIRTKTCRIYPQYNSTSCYYRRDNVDYYGWNGYCLTDDPNNPDVCLEWWPIDLIKGERFDDSALQAVSRTPLYYCLEEEFDAFATGYRYCKEGYQYVSCPDGYQMAYCHTTSEGGTGEANNDGRCEPAGDGRYRSSYSTDANDGGCAAGSIAYACVSKRCKVLTQVATANGQSKEWSGRVYSGSSYRLPVLNYAYSDKDLPLARYTPFGGAINPAGRDADNPHVWPALSTVSTASALEKIVKTVVNACINDGSCFLRNRHEEYQENCPNVSGGSGNCLYPLWETAEAPSAYYSADATTIPANYVQSVDNAAALVGRIFAKSYGSWSWGVNADAVCEFVSPVGHCSLSGTASAADDETADEIMDVPCNDSGDCVFTGLAPSCVSIGKRCGGEPDGGTCAKNADCDSGLKCEKVKTCSGSTLSAATVCSNDSNCLDRSQTCDSLGRFCDGVSGGTACVRNRDCPSGNCAEVKVCSESGAACDRDNDCRTGISVLGVCIGHCSNDALVGCSRDSDCSSGSYNAVLSPSSVVWNVPNNLCANNLRPLYVKASGEPEVYSGDRADICAVAPVVANIKINDRPNLAETVVNLNQANSSLKLDFNVLLDTNQMPLAAYRVDWGDGSVTAVSGVELRPKSNEDYSFTLYHNYDYWKLKSLGGCDGDVCRPRIKIHIRDNWGWCNSATGGLSAPFGYYAGNDVYQSDGDRGANGVYDCDDLGAWTAFNGIINVRQE